MELSGGGSFDFDFECGSRTLLINELRYPHYSKEMEWDEMLLLFSKRLFYDSLTWKFLHLY